MKALELISDASKCGQDAKARGLQAGSTACVVLQVDDHLLVASIGDSKALLCPVAACSSSPEASRSKLTSSIVMLLDSSF